MGHFRGGEVFTSKKTSVVTVSRYSGSERSVSRETMNRKGEVLCGSRGDCFLRDQPTDYAFPGIKVHFRRTRPTWIARMPYDQPMNYLAQLTQWDV